MKENNFSEFLPRFRHYCKAVDVALKEVNPEKKMPDEFYGWYLLNESMGDVANIKAKAESYSLRALENAIRTMWSGGGLAQRDAPLCLVRKEKAAASTELENKKVNKQKRTLMRIVKT